MVLLLDRAGTVLWTVPMEEKLVKSLAEELNAKNMNELNKRYHKHNWKGTCTSLGLTYKKVYFRWYLHLQPALVVDQWMTKGQLQLKVFRR